MSELSEAQKTARLLNSYPLRRREFASWCEARSNEIGQMNRDLSRALGLPGEPETFLRPNQLADVGDEWISRSQEDAKSFAESLASRVQWPLPGIPPIECVQSGYHAVALYESRDESYAIAIDLDMVLLYSRLVPVVHHALTVPEADRKDALLLLVQVLQLTDPGALREIPYDLLTAIELMVVRLYVFRTGEVDRLMRHVLHFIIAHEMSHIALGHEFRQFVIGVGDLRGLPEPIRISASFRPWEEELEADRWAADALLAVYDDVAAVHAPETCLRLWSLTHERVKEPYGLLDELARRSHPPAATRAEEVRRSTVPRSFEDCYRHAATPEGIPMLLSAVQQSPTVQLLASPRTEGPADAALARCNSPDADGRNGYSEAMGIECPKCGAHYVAKLWLLVDVGERPDLLLSACCGTLHRVACPDCDHSGELDLPLVVFAPGFRPPLFVSLRETAPRDQAIDETARLVAGLRKSLGPEWHASRYGQKDTHIILPGQRRTTLTRLAADLGLLGPDHPSISAH